MWLDIDRDKAMALHLVTVDSCDGCGQPRSESTDSVNEFAYTASPGRCHSCAAIRRTQRRFLDGAGDAQADGLTFHVTRDGA